MGHCRGAVDLLPDSMAGPQRLPESGSGWRTGIGQSRQATKGAQVIGRAADTLAPISNEPTTYDPRKAEFYSRTLPKRLAETLGAAGRASLATGGQRLLVLGWRGDECRANLSKRWPAQVMNSWRGKRRILARRLARLEGLAWAGCSTSLASKRALAKRALQSRRRSRPGRRVAMAQQRQYAVAPN